MVRAQIALARSCVVLGKALRLTSIRLRLLTVACLATWFVTWLEGIAEAVTSPAKEWYLERTNIGSQLAPEWNLFLTNVKYGHKKALPKQG